MNIEISEALWTDADHPTTLDEIAERSGLPQAFLLQLVDYELLTPHDATAMTFAMNGLETAQTASRLHQDFELDAAGLALVMRLLNQIRDLQDELRSLQARLPQSLL